MRFNIYKHGVLLDMQPLTLKEIAKRVRNLPIEPTAWGLMREGYSLKQYTKA